MKMKGKGKEEDLGRELDKFARFISFCFSSMPSSSSSFIFVDLPCLYFIVAGEVFRSILITQV